LNEEVNGMSAVWDCVEGLVQEEEKAEEARNGRERKGVRRPRVELTTGYFGLYEGYKKRVLEGKGDVRIVAASPAVGLVISRSLCVCLEWSADVVLVLRFRRTVSSNPRVSLDSFRRVTRCSSASLSGRSGGEEGNGRTSFRRRHREERRRKETGLVSS
jgi:hypothetical protein